MLNLTFCIFSDKCPRPINLVFYFLSSETTHFIFQSSGMVLPHSDHIDHFFSPCPMPVENSTQVPQIAKSSRPTGQGVIDRELACGVCSAGINSRDIHLFLPRAK